MDRDQFEELRDLPGKKIRGDIRFTPKKESKPSMHVDLRVDNDLAWDLRMTLTYNPKREARIVNVSIPSVGAICRLCVNGQNHGDAGRTHKHDLQTPECPGDNLPFAVPRLDMDGKKMKAIFDEFCQAARIVHDGNFISPD